jgi:hypothetical protein
MNSTGPPLRRLLNMRLSDSPNLQIVPGGSQMELAYQSE